MTDLSLATAEKAAVIRALAACEGNCIKAAMALGISRGCLYKKLGDYDLWNIADDRRASRRRREFQHNYVASSPVVCTGAALQPVDERRRIDRFRSNRQILKNTYYRFLRETGRAGSASLGITGKVRDLLANIDRFGADANHPLVPKLRRVLAEMESSRALAEVGRC